MLCANDGNDTHSIAASVAPTPGAVAYAWFWGLAGAEVLGAITTINSLVIAANAAGTQTAASLGATDYSANALACDGLIAQVNKAGMNGYSVQMPTGTAGTGTPLTADGEGGIVEIDTALQVFLGQPPALAVAHLGQFPGAEEHLQKDRAGSGVGQLEPALHPRRHQRRARRRHDRARISQPLRRGRGRGHRRQDPGDSDRPAPEPPRRHHPVRHRAVLLPYPLSGVSKRAPQFRARRGFYGTLWPRVRRRYEFGNYILGVLQNYFIPAFGQLSNIGNL